MAPILAGSASFSATKTSRNEVSAIALSSTLRARLHLAGGSEHASNGTHSPGEDFLLSHCGALYAVTQTWSSQSGDAVKVVVCHHVMDRADSAKRSNYKLVHRPEDA